jgi:hypothetical protein
MKTWEKLALTFLAVATAVACFNPWVEYGDLLPHILRGVEIDDGFLVDGNFTDNGGARVLVTLGLVVFLTFSAPRFPRRWPAYLLGCGIVLAALSAHELAKVWLWQRRLAGVIGAPAFMPGFFVVTGGSVLILLFALRLRSR